MSKNKLTDLNDHLFMQLERLGDENLSAEQLEQELKRADAIAAISEQIVSNADLHLRAAKYVAERGSSASHMLPMIEQKPDPMAGVKFEDKEGSSDGSR